MKRATRQLRIVLLGPVGAGKTTIFHGFVHGITERARELGFVVGWDNHPLVKLPIDEAPPPDVKLEDIHGSMAAYGRRYELVVTNPPGGDLGKKGDDDDIVKRSSDCDLVVLVVDPPSLVNPDAAQVVRRLMAAHVARLVTHRRAQEREDPVVILAFTKADEFGIPITGAPRLRFIETDSQRRAFEEWCAAYREGLGEIDARWIAFVDAACPYDDAIRALRRDALEPARKYMEDIVVLNQVNETYFNTYFIVARPGDPHVDPFPWDRRGINNIFEDFFRIVTEEQSKPRLTRRWAVGFALVCFCALFLALALPFQRERLPWLFGALPAVAVVAGMSFPSVGSLVQRLLKRKPPAVPSPTN